MSDILTSMFAQFTEESISVFALVFFLLSCILSVYWLYNRRKFREMSHQIPASVVKNYLDSIIQNSTSLKSSLFRGGGLELGEGIPSIVPVSNLPKGNVEVVNNTEELNQKNAEIAGLKSQLGDRERIITDLEEQLKNALSGKEGGEEIDRLNNELSAHKEKVAKLQEELAAAKAAAQNSSGGNPEAEAQLETVTQERDELKERLMEYEIIEEDLANLKRLQQENAELKKALGDSGGSIPEVSEPEADIEEEIEEEPEEIAEQIEPEPEPEEEVMAEAADQGGDEEQKSAEELLSEFEKMLG